MESNVVYNTKVELLYSDALASGVTVNGFKTFRAVLFWIEMLMDWLIGNVWNTNIFRNVWTLDNGMVIGNVWNNNIFRNVWTMDNGMVIGNVRNTYVSIYVWNIMMDNGLVILIGRRILNIYICTYVWQMQGQQCLLTGQPDPQTFTVVPAILSVSLYLIQYSIGIFIFNSVFY